MVPIMLQLGPTWRVTLGVAAVLLLWHLGRVRRGTGAAGGSKHGDAMAVVLLVNND